MTKAKWAILIIVVILIIDQAFKLWIKTTMYIGQEYNVLGEWFKIHFIENNGMAFGFEFGGEFGKITLSIFRMIAIGGIGYYIFYLSKRNAPTGLVLGIALIFAGAAGNLIDSAVYGMIFSDSYGKVATFLPEAGGYSSFLHGRVVDMLYFPLIEGHFPEWVPWQGGERFVFFRPVFNIADSAITTGVLNIIIFQRNFFTKEHLEADEN